MFNYNSTPMNAFTVRCVKAAEQLKKARSKPRGMDGAKPSMSIHKKPVWARSMDN